MSPSVTLYKIIFFTVLSSHAQGSSLLSQSAPPVQPVGNVSDSECVPAFEYIPFVGTAASQEPDGSVTLGSYSRVSPDGNYVLRSLSGSYLSAVTVMKLTSVGSEKTGATAIQTPLQVEAFPMMGTWRFLANPSGAYFRFADIAEKGRSAKPQFKAGMSGFYTTAAEMSVVEGKRITFRSLSWPQGDATNGTQGQGQLENKITVIEKSSSGSYSVISDSKSQYLCDNLKGSEGTLFTLPMISQDGREFSAMPVMPANRKSSMRIYELGANHRDCKLTDDLNTLTAKVIFGFSGKYFSKTPVVFRAGSTGALGGTGVYIYDRVLKRSIEIVGAPMTITASDFPGLTKDGRVVFSGYWKSCNSEGKCKRNAGYVRIDPFQTPLFQKLKQDNPERTASWPVCILKSDVRQVEAEFLKMTGLSGNL